MCVHFFHSYCAPYKLGVGESFKLGIGTFEDCSELETETHSQEQPIVTSSAADQSGTQQENHLEVPDEECNKGTDVGFLTVQLNPTNPGESTYKKITIKNLR